jgi:glycosyltransferase 2 family protein
VDDGAVPRALKRAATIAGGLLCALAAALLIVRGIQLGDAVGERLSRLTPAAFAAALALYTIGSVLLGIVWVLLVRTVAGVRLKASPLMRAHLRAQVAKYLPGNVFHFAYRHVAARREGVSHASLAAALGLEAALLIAAAGAIALGVSADPRVDALVPWARHLVWLAPFVALLAWWALGVVAPRFGVSPIALRQRASHFALVMAFNVVFFILAGIALRALCAQPDALPLGAWCGWLALAWLAGYVTPGAPAGLGLREAVLALGLAPVLGESEALALALLYRLVTVVSDGLVAAVGFLPWPASDGGGLKPTL